MTIILDFQTNVGALIISLNLVTWKTSILFVVRVLLTPEEATAAALHRAALLQPLEGAAGTAVMLLQLH